MALTEADMRKVEKMFDRLDYYEQQKVRSSQQSFNTWLYNTSYEIYRKIKDWLSDLWNWLF